MITYMFILTIILAVLLGAGFLFFGAGKLMGQPMMAEARTHLGIQEGLWKAIGGLEVLGGIGVLAGLHADLPLIGVLAAIGLIGMTIGAVYYHQKAGDAVKEWFPAVMMGSMAIFYIIVRIASS
jgi:uncharacterized membrane protein YphA (DoxX/SURF4 family)